MKPLSPLAEGVERTRPKLPGQRSREPSYRREHLPGEQATQVRLSPLRPEWYPPVAANI